MGWREDLVGDDGEVWFFVMRKFCVERGSSGRKRPLMEERLYGK